MRGPYPAFPSVSPARRFRPPGARALLLRARCVVPPGSPARARGCPVFGPPLLFLPGGPTPVSAGGAPPRVQTIFNPRSLGRGPYPAILALSVALAPLAWLFEPLQKNQLATPTKKTNHWSVGRSVVEITRNLNPISPFGVLLQGMLTANISRPRILRSVFMPPKFARANAQ